MPSQSILFIDSENIRLYEEDFYWLCFYRIKNVIQIYIYIDSTKKNSNFSFYTDMKKQFSIIEIKNVHTKNKKNTIDIQMSIDIVESVFTNNKRDTTFFIASNDTDFYIVHHKLQSLECSTGFIFLNEACKNKSLIPHHSSSIILLNEFLFDARVMMRCMMSSGVREMTIKELKKRMMGSKWRKKINMWIYHHLEFFISEKCGFFLKIVRKHYDFDNSIICLSYPIHLNTNV